MQQSEDPDLVLSAPFPITRASFARKVWRDLSGQTFVKQRFGPVRVRLRERVAGERWWRAWGRALAPERRFLIGNALGCAAFTLAGIGWVWWTLWLLPMMTWLPLVSRVRNIAEHALVFENERDPLRQARTTHAGWVERVLVAPYWVNYHAEHHLFTAVPCWNLPRAHHWLVRRAGGAAIESESGYASLLARACAG